MIEKITSYKDLIKEPVVRALVIGVPGSGKTHFSATCEDYIMLSLAKGEEETIRCNPALAKNMKSITIMNPESPEELKLLFGDLNKGISNGAIHGFFKEARETYTKGECKTLVIDTLTYLVDYLWAYINHFCKKYNSKGELDTRGMYGDLNTKATELISFGIRSFPGNIVATCHEMLESEEAMERKPDQSSPVVPNLVGGIRNKVEGMFSMVLYLEKKEIKSIVNGKQTVSYKYLARCNKGNNRNAKSRIPLPDIIEDISYGKIVSIINEVVKTN